MLYLAEIKKQIKLFMGGSKTELKLLACQHNDQSWSTLPKEEIIISEDVPQLGEGCLMIVILGGNRQIQEKPELAGPELIRQLQKISRLLEKLKEQQEEVELWKQSLNAQNEILNQREESLDIKEEEVERIQQESEYLERQRQEIQESWELLRQEEARLDQQKSTLDESLQINPQGSEQLQALIKHFSERQEGVEVLGEQYRLTVEQFRRQQSVITSYAQQLSGKKGQLTQKQQEINLRQGELTQSKEQLGSETAALESAKLDLRFQQKELEDKKEVASLMDVHWEILEDLRDTLALLVQDSGGLLPDQKVDVSALESMPLGELEATVKKLQEELDKLVGFVNDQEEELTFQSQDVAELEEKLSQANESERPELEEELQEQKEMQGMLNRTLVGQRRNLRERQRVLLTYLQVLQRRQGILKLEGENQIDLLPLVKQLEEQQNRAQQEKQKIEQEIEHLQDGIHHLQEMIDHQAKQQKNKVAEIENKETQLRELQLEIFQIQTQVNFYEGLLQPLQNNFGEIDRNLGQLGEWFTPLSNNE